MFRRLFSLANLALFASAARYPSYGTLQTTKSSGVMNVVINNTYSSINLFDQYFQSDLANLIESLQANDTDIRVVVFSSANKGFFLSHVDFNYLTPGHESPLPLFDPAIPNMLFPSALLWNITQLPQATIAAIEGRARGGGNEFLMTC
ncbi:ClpP/crotonase-like domain-containing protein [Mycena latifolia]|nr:ClpP/crotonase-like domain-containing protein [Mycena latifolia]